MPTFSPVAVSVNNADAKIASALLATTIGIFVKSAEPACRPAAVRAYEHGRPRIYRLPDCPCRTPCYLTVGTMIDDLWYGFTERLLSAATRLRWFLHRRLHNRRGWTHWHKETHLEYGELVTRRACDFCEDVLRDGER